jgi:hypothetical protein
MKMLSFVPEITSGFILFLSYFSVLSFVENGGDYAVSMVDNLLDILTKGEHAKTKMFLEQVNCFILIF